MIFEKNRQLSKIRNLLLGTSSLLFILLAFNGCKRAENDPFLSLRSRKARLTGAWKMNSGNSYSEKRDKNTHLYVTETFYTKNSLERTTDYYFQGSNQGHSVYSGNCNWEMIIKKDGSFKYSQAEDQTNKISYGKWSFSGSVGKNKAKDQLLISLDSVTVINNKTIYYKGSSIALTFSIKELRNKKMVLYSENSFLSETDVEEVFRQEFMFVQ